MDVGNHYCFARCHLRNFLAAASKAVRCHSKLVSGRTRAKIVFSGNVIETVGLTGSAKPRFFDPRNRKNFCSNGKDSCWTNMPDRITKDQTESMVTMLDTRWTLTAIAAHFGVGVKEVEQAIVKQVRAERKG
jgi:hypothetical protein